MNEEFVKFKPTSPLDCLEKVSIKTIDDDWGSWRLYWDRLLRWVAEIFDVESILFPTFWVAKYPISQLRI